MEKNILDSYCHLCKECEHVYHCFGKDIGRKIQNEEQTDLYLSPDKCNDFYPEITQ